MENSAIILAGGLGTRLRPAITDLPKCMAPVAGKPFVAYVVEHLQQQGIEHFIFALGYKSEMFQDFISQILSKKHYTLSIEQEPLGTGGAIRLACTRLHDTTTLVANGDTLFRIDVNKLSSFHHLHNAHCTLSLKPMQQFNRYGVVELNEDQSVSIFKEKQYYESGYINGGVYMLNAEKFLSENLPEIFSFEKDYLEKLYTARRMFGVIQDEYFIDIGIPEDYNRAQEELKNTI
ncbi:MAG TPA: nucleotidyltransferase family protein [Chitinophagaceae bacterium]